MLLLGALLAAPVSAGAATPRFSYRVDLTKQPAEVVAVFPIQEDKDFAFVSTLSGREVTRLKVQDGAGGRTVRAETDGVYRVLDLQPGTVQATFQLPLATECSGNTSCGDRQGATLFPGDFIMVPMGFDAEIDTPCRIDLVLPPRWTLATPQGLAELSLEFPTLAAAAATPIFPGDQFTARTSGGEQLVVQTTGWTVGAEPVAGIIGSFLHEQARLLGQRDGSRDPLVIRVVPVGAPASEPLVELSPHMFLLRLNGADSRAGIASSLVEPFREMFRARLERTLATAAGPELTWWRSGFGEYANLLAAVRSRAVPEEHLTSRLLDSWLFISGRSPLYGNVSLAQAGHMVAAAASENATPGSAAARDAARHVRDGGLIMCFLLDMHIRRGSGGNSTLASLMSSLQGKQVSVDEIRLTASRLARTDLSGLFRQSVDGTQPPPLADGAQLAGFEIADAGTGGIFTGFDLQEDAPVIRRILDSGPARDMGLQEGDRIVAVDGARLTTTAQVRATLAAQEPGGTIEITVQGGDGQLFTAGFRLWETVAPTLRKAPGAPVAASTLWSSLVRGEAATFLN